MILYRVRQDALKCVVRLVLLKAWVTAVGCASTGRPQRCRSFVLLRRGVFVGRWGWEGNVHHGNTTTVCIILCNSFYRIGVLQSTHVVGVSVLPLCFCCFTAVNRGCGGRFVRISLGNSAEKVTTRSLRHNRDSVFELAFHREHILMSHIAINRDIHAKSGGRETQHPAGTTNYSPIGAIGNWSLYFQKSNFVRPL